MPILLLVVGVMLIIVAVNDKLPELKELVGEDFAPSDGSTSFILWIVALFVAGSIGFIKGFKPVANAFLVLIIIGIILSNKGFFNKFMSSLSDIPNFVPQPDQVVTVKAKGSGLLGSIAGFIGSNIKAAASVGKLIAGG